MQNRRGPAAVRGRTLHYVTEILFWEDEADQEPEPEKLPVLASLLDPRATGRRCLRNRFTGFSRLQTVFSKMEGRLFYLVYIRPGQPSYNDLPFSNLLNSQAQGNDAVQLPLPAHELGRETTGVIRFSQGKYLVLCDFCPLTVRTDK